MSQYLPKLCKHSDENIEVELNLSNYAAKADLKGATGVDTSNLEAKSDLVTWKPEVDKIDIGELKSVPVDLSEINDVVDNDVIKKTT